MHISARTFCILSLLFLATSCQPRLVTEIPGRKGSSEQLLSELYHRNQGLETFKGIGKIRLWNASGSLTARIAWFCAIDGRMRVEIIGPAGPPLMKIAYDGSRFHFFQAGSEIRRKRARNPNLRQVVAVPVTVRELVFFLAGRFPLYAHEEVEPVAGGGKKPYLLILSENYGGWRETIRIGEDHTIIEAVQLFEDGSLRYQADLSSYRSIEGYSIPSVIRITGGGGEGFEIRMERFWPNPALTDGQFVISPA
jgi:hypothetical protein